MGVIMKNDKSPYLKFTPFYKKCILQQPRELLSLNPIFNFIRDSELSERNDNLKFLCPIPNDKLFVRGGRKNALIILQKLKNGIFNNYDTERDYPYLNKTTKLSAYIKFGCISIREIYYSLSPLHEINRELYWHDFYAIITNYFPTVLNGKSFKSDKIKWEDYHNDELFNKWKTGMTGFPLIDAAMRQLNTCGWMHNRCRMLVASFLVKNLLIDWRKGEKYFAKSLVDYDPSSNNGGWQWCASTGTDSQPYFRIFSPTLQKKLMN